MTYPQPDVRWEIRNTLWNYTRSRDDLDLWYENLEELTDAIMEKLSDCGVDTGPLGKLSVEPATPRR